MDVVGGAWHDAAGVERMKLGLRAQIFLKAVQGTLTVTWERPEELQEALLEFMASQHDHGGIDARLLLSYLDVLRSPLVKMCEPEDAGCEPQIQPPERSLKRRKPQQRGASPAEKAPEVGRYFRRIITRGDQMIRTMWNPRLMWSAWCSRVMPRLGLGR